MTPITGLRKLTKLKHFRCLFIVQLLLFLAKRGASARELSFCPRKTSFASEICEPYYKCCKLREFGNLSGIYICVHNTTWQMKLYTCVLVNRLVLHPKVSSKFRYQEWRPFYYDEDYSRYFRGSAVLATRLQAMIGAYLHQKPKTSYKSDVSLASCESWLGSPWKALW